MLSVSIGSDYACFALAGEGIRCPGRPAAHNHVRFNLRLCCRKPVRRRRLDALPSPAPEPTRHREPAGVPSRTPPSVSPPAAPGHPPRHPTPSRGPAHRRLSRSGRRGPGSPRLAAPGVSFIRATFAHALLRAGVRHACIRAGYIERVDPSRRSAPARRRAPSSLAFQPPAMIWPTTSSTTTTTASPPGAGSKAPFPPGHRGSKLQP